MSNIGSFAGPDELYESLKDPGEVNFTVLLAPQNWTSNLRTAYEIGFMGWQEVWDSLMLHVLPNTAPLGSAQFEAQPLRTQSWCGPTHPLLNSMYRMGAKY